ncbi:MAG: hypothetical protein V4584_02870 [Verrucomicrobiota bacterium]
MSPEITTTFLTGYLHGLREETRDEKSGPKYGFDHVILKLAEADDLIPLRLAFHRGGRNKAPKPKKEHEYGEDLKVINRDGKKLTIFVLKDEALTYKNWLAAGFEKDVRLAASQDLTTPEMRSVTEVRIVVAYNKEDEARGVEAYERLAKSLGTTVGNSAKLIFERWNLTTITDKVKEKLIGSPALLPEQFFRSFSYICWQVEDFSHGSEQWREVLIPDWREFLGVVLRDGAGEKEARLISMALVILHAHGKKEPSWETGWIEMMEWAVLALWSAVRKSNTKSMAGEVFKIWMSFYLAELEAYYERNAVLLATEDSLTCGFNGHFTEAISTHHAYWHLARLGILGCSFLQMEQFMPDDKSGNKEAMRKGYNTVVDTLVKMMNANSACRRPLLDIHHIELFLSWLLLAASNRGDEVLEIFHDIHERLIFRRIGHGGVRVIDQSNSWALLLEFMATNEPPSESFGKSSYLLQMIIEICVCKLGREGEALAWAFFQHLVLGQDDFGKSFEFPETVELQSWVPPSAWLDKVLAGPVGNEGICVTVQYSRLGTLDVNTFSPKVREFVETMRNTYPAESLEGIPYGAVVLACVMHDSPIPPEFWRSALESPPPFKSRRKSKAADSKRTK